MKSNDPKKTHPELSKQLLDKINSSFKTLIMNQALTGMASASPSSLFSKASSAPETVAMAREAGNGEVIISKVHYANLQEQLRRASNRAEDWRKCDYTATKLNDIAPPPATGFMTFDEYALPVADRCTHRDQAQRLVLAHEQEGAVITCYRVVKEVRTLAWQAPKRRWRMTLRGLLEQVALWIAGQK